MPGPQNNDGEERTEQATQFRREEFRRQGSVAMSRELLSVAILATVGFTLYATTSLFFKEFTLLSQKYLGFAGMGEITRDALLEMRGGILKSFLFLSGPLVIAALTAGLIACVAQVGMMVTWDPVQMKWDRLNPVNGFQRLFSAKGLVEAVKAVLKMTVVLSGIYFFVKSQALQVGKLFSVSIPEALSLTINALGGLFMTLLMTLVALSGLDYFFQRFQLEKQMRMTKREAKEEFKMREGDPLMKSRIRSVQRRLASRRMMEEVPKADVILTNPTHLAVALKYDSDTMPAPRVIAKGAGVVAQKIKELARFHQIPCVENKPLARTLFKTLDINEYIPRDLYKAVAEVLAYVYRLKRRLVNG